jgi:hypothetical protein
VKLRQVGPSQVLEQDEVHGVEDGHVMMVIKLRTWKRRKRKTKWAQGKSIFDRVILFCHSRHQMGLSGFRIDSRTIKRGETRREIQLSKCH